MKALLIYMTCSAAEEASRIARAIIERRLAACANIFPAHQAMYWWDNKIESAEEVAVIFKTRADLFEKVEREIKTLHSYDCPCVIALPIEKGHKPFLDWIESETDIRGN